MISFLQKILSGVENTLVERKLVHQSAGEKGFAGHHLRDSTQNIVESENIKINGAKEQPMISIDTVNCEELKKKKQMRTANHKDRSITPKNRLHIYVLTIKILKPQIPN